MTRRSARQLAWPGLLLFAWLAAGRPDATAQSIGALPEAREQARRLVVMVDGRFDDEATRGAGLVIGTSGDRLYVATAYHVVRRDGAVAQDVTVRLLTVPGQRFPATVLEHADRWLDLAVLSVVGERGLPPSTAGVPFASLGAPRELKLGDPLFAVGNPLGTAWGDNLTPYLYRKSDGDQFAFEALSIQVGHSGGGVFDQRWRLLGMIVRDEPPDAVALSIERIIGRLADWGYPIALGAAPGPGGPGPFERPPVTPPSRTPPPTAARPPPASRPGLPGAPSPDELRQHVLTALRARQVEGLQVGVADDLTVSLAGRVVDQQTLRTALRAPREVNGVRIVDYNLAIAGSERGRTTTTSVTRDVLLARAQHNLTRARLTTVQVAVDSALNAHVTGTVATDVDLSRVLSAVRSATPRSLSYEITVVGRSGR